jgi:hypothetical protein
MELEGPKSWARRASTPRAHGQASWPRGWFDDVGRAARGGPPAARMGTADDEHELAVESYEYFAERDPLTRAVMDRDARRRLDAQVRPGLVPFYASARTSETARKVCKWL